MQLRDLPSVDELARRSDDPLAVEAARIVLARAREEIRAGGRPGDLGERLQEQIDSARAPHLRRVLNATGVIVHTNLGRAPLAQAALDRIRDIARGYSNLEYDVAAGGRGSRQDHVTTMLRRLTGAEAGLAVNNNAAAVMLALAALAEGRDVLVSRGELIEIGDGFRIPDVLERSGARLREVGTTNRTRATDYEAAIGSDTAVLLRVHQSNFRIVGFTEQPSLEDLAQVARRHELVLVDDLGSGALVDVGDEPTARSSLAAGGGPGVRRARGGGRRADGTLEPGGGRRSRVLLGRQAARGAAGGDRGRPRGSRREAAPAPAAACAAGRQAHAGRTRGDADGGD